MPRLTPAELEQKISAVLREQPERRAPSSLEIRVRGEIARREAMPWWHKTYVCWPNPVKLGFLVLGTALAAVVGLSSMQLAGLIGGDAVMAFAQPVVGAGSALQSMGSSLWGLLSNRLPEIQMQWLYVGLAFIGWAYALAIGLGATAYRVLWPHR